MYVSKETETTEVGKRNSWKNELIKVENMKTNLQQMNIIAMVTLTSELVYSTESRQTLTLERTRCVDTNCVAMTMVSMTTTSLRALISIWIHKHNDHS